MPPISERFRHKRILIFSPQFFDYGKEISIKLQELGAQVDLYDERPGNDFLTKAIIRVNKSLLANKIESYYRRIITSLEPHYYDYVLFLNPEAISEKSLQHLRKCQSTATFIIYMWDSVKNKKHTRDLLPYFHKKHSFDREDSANPGYGFTFRPLFFLDSYSKIKDLNDATSIDLLFVGTIHSDRYEFLMRIREICMSIGLSTDYFMYFPNKKLFYLQKATNMAFKKAKLKDFEFKALPRDVLLQKVQKSRVILDIQHPSQEGLTMRTIETIGAGKKLLTTNRQILKYDFYDSNNIRYLDRYNPKLDKSFFESEYHDLNDEVYKKYSIEGWLDAVFTHSESVGVSS